MKLYKKSEWFEYTSPIGEPDINWKYDSYLIERTVDKDGTIIWFGINTNWKKKKDGVWTVLTKNEDAKPIEKYLPTIMYGNDRMVFVETDTPIYELDYDRIFK